jgi:large subunit ribosomal protein L25
MHTVGEPKGVKLQGGLHELITREIEIECLPDDIPEHFTVDVSQLSIGEAVRAGDVPLGDAIKLVSPGEAVISHVIALKAEEEAAATTTEGAPAAGSEPEVVKKGKKDDDEAPEKDKKKK